MNPLHGVGKSAPVYTPAALKAPLEASSPVLLSAENVEALRNYQSMAGADSARLRQQTADILTYRRALRQVGSLGLSADEREALRAEHPDNQAWRTLLAFERNSPAEPAAARPTGELGRSLVERCGQALRHEIQKMGEKSLKVAENLARTAREFEAVPQLAQRAPAIGKLAKSIGVFANTLRGGTAEDPKQMAADFAKAVRELLKLLELAGAKQFAKVASKLLPGLGEVVIGWDIYQAGKKAEEASRRGDKAAGAAWSSVMALNTLAFSFRSTCDLAALVTGLTAGAAAPATGGLMAGCEAVVGVLAGVAEFVALGLD